MKHKLVIVLLIASMAFLNARNVDPAEEWISLFDGKTFNGWKINENPATFHIEGGMIVANGERSHLFYDGDVMKHNFKNFEFKTKVMTTPGSNSGIFIHTVFQPDGWPSKGYEIQVNNTHTDWRKTGSIYAVKDVRETPAKDNEWFTESVTVIGKTITVKINDVVVNEYTEEPGKEKLSSGTFALQGHDPKSKVFYKDIMVKPLPD